jgi:hypothetical protein
LLAVDVGGRHWHLETYGKLAKLQFGTDFGWAMAKDIEPVVRLICSSP